MAIKIKFSEGQKAVDRGLRELERAFDPQIIAEEMRKVLKQTLAEVRQNVIDEAPQKTGKLRRGIWYKIDGPDAGRVISRQWYSHFVEGRTKAHPIAVRSKRRKHRVVVDGRRVWRTDKRKRGLTVGGGVIRGAAQHPGTSADPFMERGLAGSKQAIDRLMKQTGHVITTTIERRTS